MQRKVRICSHDCYYGLNCAPHSLMPSFIFYISAVSVLYEKFPFFVLSACLTDLVWMAKNHMKMVNHSNIK